MARKPGDTLAQLELRPQVPMGAFQALGYVCVMGAAEGLHKLGVPFAAVGWPFDVTDSRTDDTLLTLRLRAGYDKGMFGACTIAAGHQVTLLRAYADDELVGALQEGVAARVSSWEEQILAGRGAAGPLAPVLSDYFDLVALMGRPAVAVYPNGNVMARGTFAGMDVWGRATLVLPSGKQVEIAPEHASLRRDD